MTAKQTFKYNFLVFRYGLRLRLRKTTFSTMDAEKYFKTNDLYKILGLERCAEIQDSELDFN